MKNPKLTTNPLRTRSDLQRTLLDLMTPLYPCYSQGAVILRNLQGHR